MKTQTIIYFVIALLSYSCSNESSRDGSNTEQDFLIKTIDFIVDRCDNQYIEFPYLYNELSENIPEDSSEHIKIVELLKNKGFEITEYGRGNYPPRGPRIISVDLSDGKCNCYVNKIYYSTTVNDAYEVSERIRCEKIPHK